MFIQKTKLRLQQKCKFVIFIFGLILDNKIVQTYRIDKCFKQMKNDGTVSFACDLPNANPLNTLNVLNYSYKNEDGELNGCIKASELDVTYMDKGTPIFVSRVKMPVVKFEKQFKTNFKNMENITLISKDNVLKIHGKSEDHDLTSIITSNDSINVQGSNEKIKASYDIGMLQKCAFKQCDTVEMKIQDTKMLWVEFTGCEHVRVEYFLAPKLDLSDDEDEDEENKRIKY